MSPIMFVAAETIMGDRIYWDHLPRAGVSIFSGMAMELLCGMVNTVRINAEKTKELQK